jgi:hypothetical protein
MKLSTSTPRFLLARPLGGLNDVLCQVEYARRIAKKTNRKLVVQAETGSPNLKHRFGQPFSEVFEFIDVRNKLEPVSLVPLFTKNGRVFPGIYNTFSTWLDKSLEELTDGVEVQSRLIKHPPRKCQIAIHEGFGGGPDSFRLLEHVLLVPHLYREAQSIVAKIPAKCTAIHFRNSDYRSSFEKLSQVVAGVDRDDTILLATDDASILPRLRAEFPTHKLTSASDLLTGLPLSTPTEKAVLELLLISNCPELVLIPLEGERSTGPNYSGFGLLAKHLWSVRRIQEKGLRNFFIQLADIALASPRRQKSIFRLIAFLALRAPEFLRQCLAPTGVYRQMMSVR